MSIEDRLKKLENITVDKYSGPYVIFFDDIEEMETKKKELGKKYENFHEGDIKWIIRCSKKIVMN